MLVLTIFAWPLVGCQAALFEVCVRMLNFFSHCNRASRGLDSFDVEHVVLFDYPRDPSEYVRRVGRTARGAGGTGKVFVFALGKQVAMARRIMARNEKGRPIHDVPGSEYEM
jgi:ATP-dependent RNA helicase DDX18/HAS1